MNKHSAEMAATSVATVVDGMDPFLAMGYVRLRVLDIAAPTNGFELRWDPEEFVIIAQVNSGQVAELRLPMKAGYSFRKAKAHMSAVIRPVAYHLGTSRKPQ